MVIECRVSALARGSVRVAVIERERGAGTPGIRVATWTGSVSRWHRWRALLTAGAEATGQPLVITGRESPAA